MYDRKGFRNNNIFPSNDGPEAPMNNYNVNASVVDFVPTLVHKIHDEYYIT